MNPLTQVKRIQKLNSTEAALGISDEASWHARYKDSAYVFVGGIAFDLTEGDLLAVFAQYGEVVDVNLVRDKATGKSRGFAFLAYEDQRSTILAVDNLNGAKVLGRIIRVDHVSKYKKKEEEDEEEQQKKREARGVCRAFQRGECTRGASCKFSHDEQRCANTGWGPKESDSRWGHDKYDDPRKDAKKHKESGSGRDLRHRDDEDRSKSKAMDRDGHSSRSDRMKDFSGHGKEDDRNAKAERYGRDHKQHRHEYSPERRKSDRKEDDRDRHGGRKRSADDRDGSFLSEIEEPKDRNRSNRL